MPPGRPLHLAHLRRPSAARYMCAITKQRSRPAACKRRISAHRSASTCHAWGRTGAPCSPGRRVACACPRRNGNASVRRRLRLPFACAAIGSAREVVELRRESRSRIPSPPACAPEPGTCSGYPCGTPARVRLARQDMFSRAVVRTTHHPPFARRRHRELPPARCFHGRRSASKHCRGLDREGWLSAAMARQA